MALSVAQCPCGDGVAPRGGAVADFPRAAEWYGRLFGRDADVVAHDREVLWQVTATGWPYVVEDVARAGRGPVAIEVPDLDDAVTDLGTRGIRCGPIGAGGDGARKAVATDPAGNTIPLIEVTSA
jgi:catechol 2,3-dioxygenase-like lactoylglutathione lyase family enzyme